MANIKFKQAKAENIKLRMAIIGPSGSGKSWTCLEIATHLLGGYDAYGKGDIAVIDTERRSMLKYARRDRQRRGSGAWEFLYCELETHHPQNYIDAINASVDAGAKIVIVDSLSHAWAGKEGELELVNQESARSKSNNSFAAWRNVTPLHNRLLDTILGVPIHVFCTMRVKTEYVIEKDEKGRQQIRKVGLSPVMRDGVEYEFDVVADMEQGNTLTVSKTRCSGLNNKQYHRPGAEIATILREWLMISEPVEPTKTKEEAAPAAARGLTEEQQQHLLMLAARADVDVARYLEMFQAASFENITDYDAAEAFLNLAIFWNEKEFDVKKFLDFFKVGDIYQMKPDQIARAVKLLQNKPEKAKVAS